MNRDTFFEPPAYNHIGREKLWLDVVVLSHDTWCGCNHPLAHLLNSLLPIGHKDRELTVEEILLRDLKVCHSGGTEERNGGDPEDLNTGDGPTEEELEKIFTEDAIEELLTAAANDEEPR